MASLSTCTASMTQDKKDYFKRLGSLAAQLRKDFGLTQNQLAEALEIPQRIAASVEVSCWRFLVSRLQSLVRQMERIGALPKTQ